MKPINKFYEQTGSVFQRGYAKGFNQCIERHKETLNDKKRQIEFVLKEAQRKSDNSDMSNEINNLTGKIELLNEMIKSYV